MPGSRYDPMPSLPALPAWMWRRAGWPLRTAAVVFVGGGLLGLAGLVLYGAGIRDDASRAESAHRAGMAERLRADQAPRRATVAAPLSAAAAIVSLEDAVARDAGMRLAGTYAVECRQLHPLDGLGRPIELAAADAAFTCFARQRTIETRAGRLAKGYYFRARVDLEAGTLSWCKLNPRPIHADQEEFVTVKLPEACVPRG